GAVHRGDDRRVHAGEVGNGRVQVGGEFADVVIAGGVARGHGAQVAAEAEVAAGTGEHDRAHLGIAGAGERGGQQVHAHLQVERVGALGPVQGHQGDGTAGFDLDAGGGHARSSYSSGAMLTRRPASSGVNST